MATKLTDLEIKLLNNIAYDEMNPANSMQPQNVDEVGCYLWADERASALGISEQAVGGVLTSLQKKGLIGVTAPNCKMSEANREGSRGPGQDPDGGVWFTDEGFAAWQIVDNADYMAAPVEPAEPVVGDVRKYQLNVCYNKNGTVTFYVHGKKVRKLADGNSVDAFLTGWFGTDDKTSWNTRTVVK